MSLGAQDSYTGWYAVTFSASTIKGSIQPKGSSFGHQKVGDLARYNHTLFYKPSVNIYPDDQIVDNAGNYYKVETTERFAFLSTVVYRQASLQEMTLPADAPTTSGTWNAIGDPRYRTKVWLDTYLTGANLLKNNGSTQASSITQFSDPPYSIPRIFYGGKDVDIVFTILSPSSTPVLGAFHKAYAYEETVPIMVSTLDKTAITGVNLLWQGDLELRRLQETYATVCTTRSLFRSFTKTSDSVEDVGGMRLFNSVYELRYKRATD